MSYSFHTEEDLFPLQYARQGDIVKLDGLWYRIERKTTTAVSLSRYYWYHRLWDRLTKGKEV
jgi:hypothetical protein